MSADPEVLDAVREAIAEIAEGAVDRERQRRLLHEEVAALVRCGFTALRVPRELGGAGASLPQLFDLLVELAAADPNLPQALRGHLGLVERFLVSGAEEDEQWLRRAVAGELFANAQAEAGPTTATTTVLERAEDGEGWRLSGRKFYTTGTLYADWTWTNGVDEAGQRWRAIAPVKATGVQVLDDWTGFGQRLTASGTTVFDGVHLRPEHVHRVKEEPQWWTLDVRVLFHLLLQATMAGIAVAAVRDAVTFVRGRTRSFGIAGEHSPRHDPRVHGVLGEMASRTAAVQALVRDVARDYEQTRARDHGEDPGDLARTADYVRLQVRQFEAQHVAVADVVAVTNALFEVGGASAVLTEKGLDRHWRNARVIASHNPAVFRTAAIGDYLLNGTVPEAAFRG